MIPSCGSFAFMKQKYRVFLNERSIEITQDINTGKHECWKQVHYSPGMMHETYERFEAEPNCKKLVIFAPGAFAEACSAFGKLFHRIDAAGGIVKNDNGETLFIRRYGMWDLPKGKLEKGEAPLQGAVREVQEETGLRELEILHPLPSTFHIYTGRHYERILKETSWFRMLAPGVQQVIPQTEEDISEIRWVKKENLGEYVAGTYASLRDLFEQTGERL